MINDFVILFQDLESNIIEYECSVCGEVFIADYALGINLDISSGDRARCPNCDSVDNSF